MKNLNLTSCSAVQSLECKIKAIKTVHYDNEISAFKFKQKWQKNNSDKHKKSFELIMHLYLKKQQQSN